MLLNPGQGNVSRLCHEPRVALAVLEEMLALALMGRGLSLSPTILFVSFVFWFWLLGGAGAFLAMPLTVFAALMLDTFLATRWLTNLIFVYPSSTATSESATPSP